MYIFIIFTHTYKEAPTTFNVFNDYRGDNRLTTGVTTGDEAEAVLGDVRTDSANVNAYSRR